MIASAKPTAKPIANTIIAKPIVHVLHVLKYSANPLQMCLRRHKHPTRILASTFSFSGASALLAVISIYSLLRSRTVRRSCMVPRSNASSELVCLVVGCHCHDGNLIVI